MITTQGMMVNPNVTTNKAMMINSNILNSSGVGNNFLAEILT